MQVNDMLIFFLKNAFIILKLLSEMFQMAAAASLLAASKAEVNENFIKACR